MIKFTRKKHGPLPSPQECIDAFEQAGTVHAAAKLLHLGRRKFEEILDSAGGQRLKGKGNYVRKKPQSFTRKQGDPLPTLEVAEAALKEAGDDIHKAARLLHIGRERLAKILDDGGANRPTGKGSTTPRKVVSDDYQPGNPPTDLATIRRYREWLGEEIWVELLKGGQADGETKLD